MCIFYLCVELRLAEALVSTQQQSTEAAARYEAMISETHAACRTLKEQLRIAVVERGEALAELSTTKDALAAVENARNNEVAAYSDWRTRLAESEAQQPGQSSAQRVETLERDLFELMTAYERVTVMMDAMAHDCQQATNTAAHALEVLAGAADELDGRSIATAADDDEFLRQIMERRRLRVASSSRREPHERDH